MIGGLPNVTVQLDWVIASSKALERTDGDLIIIIFSISDHELKPRRKQRQMHSP